MADHTGSKIEKEAKDRQSSVVSVNRMMLSGSNRKSTKGKNTVKDKPEAEVKKKVSFPPPSPLQPKPPSLPPALRTNKTPAETQPAQTLSA